MSMWRAPASRAFSTSSLTALAGRSTTSPAAMRLTVSGGRRWIGMAVRHSRRFRWPMRLGVLALAAALAWPVAAQTPTPPAPPPAGAQPYDPDAVLVEE